MHKKKTLIVDSDPSLRSVFEFMLSQTGQAAISTQDGTTCLQLIENDSSIELVFLDSNISDIPSKTILKEIHNKKPNIMVILMASDHFIETLNTGYQDGAYGVICKPFDIEEVLSIIKKVMEISKNE